MGLFDLFEDVKENMEKSKEAREYIQRAKELVKEGDSIYKTAYEKVNSYATETKFRLYQHISYKKKIAKELNGDIGKVLQEFKDFDIGEKIESSSLIEKTECGMKKFESTFVSCFPINRDINKQFDWFISDEDYYEAQNQYYDAKFYKNNMKLEREKLYSYKEKLSEIHAYVTDNIIL